jgi:hypothetical protein
VFRKLNREHSHIPTRTDNDDALVSLDLERIVDPLYGCERDGRRRAGTQEIESSWDARDARVSDGNIFGVEASLRAAEVERVDSVAHPEASHSSTAGDHGPRSIRTQHEREMSILDAPGARTLVRFPASDSRRIDGDHDIASAHSWKRQLMNLQDGRRTDAIDRGGAHRRWKEWSRTATSFFLGYH